MHSLLKSELITDKDLDIGNFTTPPEHFPLTLT